MTTETDGSGQLEGGPDRDFADLVRLVVDPSLARFREPMDLRIAAVENALTDESAELRQVRLDLLALVEKVGEAQRGVTASQESLREHASENQRLLEAHRALIQSAIDRISADVEASTRTLSSELAQVAAILQKSQEQLALEAVGQESHRHDLLRRELTSSAGIQDGRIVGLSSQVGLLGDSLQTKLGRVERALVLMAVAIVILLALVGWQLLR